MQTLFACSLTISPGMHIMKLLQKRCVCSIICTVLWLFIYFKEYLAPENRVAIWWFCYGRHQKVFRSAKQHRNKARNDIRAVCSKLSGKWPVRVHGAYRRHVGKPACRPESISRQNSQIIQSNSNSPLSVFSGHSGEISVMKNLPDYLIWQVLFISK